MSYFNNTSMTLSILTRGWLVRVFVLLLWLVAIILGLFLPDEDVGSVIVFIIGANFFLYFIVSSRLLMLVHNSMSGLLANYFYSIKKSLLIILLVSFLPSLILVLHPLYWFSLLSTLILMATFLIAITYQPKLYWLFIIFILIASPGNVLSTFFAHFNMPLLLSYALPVIAWFAYMLLSKLERFKGDGKHIERMHNIMNVNLKKSLVVQEDVSFKSRNKLSQWLINSNYGIYRLLINSDKVMPNNQLIATTCQSVASIGRSTYVFWLFAVLLYSIILQFSSEEYFHLFIPFSVIFPTFLIGTGTLSLFQVINQKKSLLQRLAIMPCFAAKHSFSRAFVTYIISNQLKLYVFISLIIALLVNGLGYISWDMYINISITAILLCFFNLSLMLINWSAKRAFDGVVIWLMLIAFFTATVFLMLVHSDESIQLINSHIFAGFFFGGVALFAISLYRSYQRLPSFS